MSRITIVAISFVTLVGGSLVALNAVAAACCSPQQHDKSHSSTSGDEAKTESQASPVISSPQKHHMMDQQHAEMMEKAGVPEQMMHHIRIMMHSRMFLDDPGAIYGQAEILGLTEQQTKQLTDIQEQARKRALLVLTAEQREKMGRIPAQPLTMAGMCQQMCEKMMPMMQKMMGDKGTAGSMMMCPMMQWMSKSKDAQAQTAEQTTCPVMGGAINKAIFTAYKGKKVYFCCPSCKENFEADPQKYIAKLPQFK